MPYGCRPKLGFVHHNQGRQLRLQQQRRQVSHLVRGEHSVRISLPPSQTDAVRPFRLENEIPEEGRHLPHNATYPPIRGRVLGVVTIPQTRQG
jgi:hypothetical protein